MITIRQIEAFRAIMTTGTATQAALLLDISQPAVSRLIFDLEEAIGFKLFIRSNRQLQPTPEGEALYDEVLRAFIGIEHISRAATEIGASRKGHVRLISIPALVGSVVTKAIAEFGRQYPNVLVSLEVEPSHRIFDWVLSHHADIGFATINFDSDAVISELVASTPSLCLVHRTSPLAEKEVIKPQDLLELPFISFKPDTLFRHRVDTVFRDAKVERRLSVEVRSTEAVFALVNEGVGVSVVQGSFHATERFENVVAKPFEPKLDVNLVAFYSRRAPLSFTSEQFLSVLRATMAT
ncbi:LysR substrate-binding domain-containing protein [Ensifer sp. SSB1]|uniref:LysR family transcriptional regulator n=1 Tax=Ensifer sp. SSB1 TaxID=2795385 RepID=UPI001A60FF44|nr:LysR substrate-binding domain-containing protein [Ensifer sp. SSB1]MBK5567083.1 LysR family transcriptional regulator [Ensifer sp. SSB1]